MRWFAAAFCAAAVLAAVACRADGAHDWPGEEERPPSADYVPLVTSAATTESALSILDRIRQSSVPQDALSPALTTSTESVLHLLNKWRQMLTTPRPKPPPTTAPPTTAVTETTAPISEESEATTIIPETTAETIIVFETTTGEDVALTTVTASVPATQSSTSTPRTLTVTSTVAATNALPVETSFKRNSTSVSSEDVMVAADREPAPWPGRTEIAAIAASCVVLLLLLACGAALTVFCCKRKFSRRNIYTTMWTTTASTPSSALRGLTRPGPPVILKHEMLQQKYKPKKSNTMPAFAERKL
jgi:hypothetical protein